MTSIEHDARESHMHTAMTATGGTWFEGVQSRLVYCTLLPLFLVTEGGRRLGVRLRADEDEEAPPARGWVADALRQTSIATSYALMARSMLQSSERRTPPGTPVVRPIAPDNTGRVGRAR